MRDPKSFGLALAGLVLPGAVHSQTAVGHELQGTALVRALQHGGYALVIRHAHAPAEAPLASAADPENPNRERQLDQPGRAAAQAMGQAMHSMHIPVGEIWSSPTYRARQTVTLAGLPAPQIAPELGDRGQSMQAANTDQGAWLRAKAAELPRSGTDTIIVTHLPIISAAFGAMATGLGDGGALVFRALGNGHYALVARVAIEDWPRLAAR
jgi:phosphohistidine phosphatase SixA